MKTSTLLSLEEPEASQILSTMKLKHLERIGEKMAKKIGATTYQVWLANAIRILSPEKLEVKHSFTTFTSSLFGDENPTYEKRLFAMILMLVVRAKFNAIHTAQTH